MRYSDTYTIDWNDGGHQPNSKTSDQTAGNEHGHVDSASLQRGP